MFEDMFNKALGHSLKATLVGREALDGAPKWPIGWMVPQKC